MKNHESQLFTFDTQEDFDTIDTRDAQFDPSEYESSDEAVECDWHHDVQEYGDE